VTDMLVDRPSDVPASGNTASEWENQPGASKGPIGVDVGTCRIAVSRKVSGEVVTSRQLNAFFSVPYLKFTQEVLEKNRVNYFVDDDSLVIIGDAAAKFSVVMNSEIRRPMREGLLNPLETKGQRVIQKILELLVQAPENLGESVCLNLPAVPHTWRHRLTYHETILRDFFTSMGYRVKTVNEGLAVVLTELAETDFTGIGISLGGGMCNGCLSYLSIPILNFSIPQAGDYIDDSVAAVMSMLPTEVRLIKENELDLSRPPHNHVENALRIFYDEVSHAVLEELRKALLKSNKLPQIRQPVPVVLAGGTVMPNGFLDRFRKIFAEFSFPIPVSGVKMAHDPLTAPVRGALIAADSEPDSMPRG